MDDDWWRNYWKAITFSKLFSHCVPNSIGAERENWKKCQFSISGSKILYHFTKKANEQMLGEKVQTAFSGCVKGQIKNIDSQLLQ